MDEAKSDARKCYFHSARLWLSALLVLCAHTTNATTTNYYNSNILVLYAMQCGECDGIRQPMLACPAYFFFLSSLWYLYRINVVAHHIVFDMLRKFIKLHSIFIYELHLCRQVAVEEYLWAALHQERLRFFYFYSVYLWVEYTVQTATGHRHHSLRVQP